MAYHAFGILAYTDSSPPLTALAEIQLQVVDVNDHAPEFDNDVYSVSIPENIPEGTTVVKGLLRIPFVLFILNSGDILLNSLLKLSPPVLKNSSFIGNSKNLPSRQCSSKLIILLKYHLILYIWIPEHCGNRDNMVADVLAREFVYR